MEMLRTLVLASVSREKQVMLSTAPVVFEEVPVVSLPPPSPEVLGPSARIVEHLIKEETITSASDIPLNSRIVIDGVACCDLFGLCRRLSDDGGECRNSYVHLGREGGQGGIHARADDL